MKKIIIAAALTAALTLTTAAQESKNEKQELTERISVLYQRGDLEEAIKLGEKLVGMEKSSADQTSYVNALINLARLKRAFFASRQNDLRSGKYKGAQMRAMSEKASRSADEAEDLFREALEINEKSGKEKTAQTADLKKDLAWLVSNHGYSGKKTVEKSRSRIDEAEKFLLESLALSEETRGASADETLFTALEAGDFYYKYVNFEKALLFYERFIENYGRKHGAQHADLVGALRPLASILVATYRDAEATLVLKRIEAITKKSEPAPRADIDLHLRSKDSVAYSAPLILEANEKAEGFRNRLRSQGGTLNSNNISQMPGLMRVPVEIEVDETGKIIKTTARTDNDKLKAEAESTVIKWTVRPFSYNGTARRMRGILIYRKAP